MRVRDALPVEISHLPAGQRNAIADVPGVTVGHRTLADEADVNTGVTVVRPHDGVVFEQPVLANAFVLNGFGKSTGLMQLRELGELETPLALTNTLDVGTAANALVDHTLDAADGDVRSVNPLVLECNDGHLNDIRGRHVDESDVHAGLETASETVEAGAVGAGRGMTAFGRKGGIGTASRRITVDGDPSVVGALVLSNFGRLRDLRVGGVPVGKRLADEPGEETPAEDTTPAERDDGSIAMVVATDAPLDARQLGRVAKRAPLGMARTGGYAHHGSGDLAVAFSTAGADTGRPVSQNGAVADAALDEVFEAAADATEGAILHSLLAAERVTGRGGNVVEALGEAAVERALRAYPWTDEA